MNETRRNVLFGVFLFLLVGIFGIFTYFKFFQPGFFTGENKFLNIGVSAVFMVMLGLMVNELLHWKKQGKRSEAFDLVLIVFIFISIYLATFDILNSVIGAFGIFIIFGAYELREYEVLNKLLIITAVTYNVIFIAGLVNAILNGEEYGINILEPNNWIIRDSAFSFAIWIILILGFALFGRKYLVVLRFMSPEYLTMLLYIIAWLAVRTSSLIWKGALEPEEQRIVIYIALMVTNWVVYAISGPILDWMLGIRRVSKSIQHIESKLQEETDREKRKELENEKHQYIQLQRLVAEVSGKVGLKKPVKVGFAQYPILNAMAYGAFFDKRIAIISNDINEIPQDELKGIIGHELHHAKGLDTLILSLMGTIQLLIFMAIPNWPATYYDYVFSEEKPTLPLWTFIVVNFGITLIIYIFIRMLEGRADRRTKQSGFGNELAKGLYNLEGFYSSGREIGLDTMLLSEERLIEYNKVENYSTTAQYLDENMTNPKPLNLLSNLMNSHPPSYLRILAMYDNDDQILPAKESVLPFLLMNKAYRLNFTKNLKPAQKSYRKMANAKFKSMFGIENYAHYLNKQKKKEVYEHLFGKPYLHVDAENFTVGVGVLQDLKIKDEVCEPFQYIFTPLHPKYPEEEQNLPEIREIMEYNRSKITDNVGTTYSINRELFKLIELEFGALYQVSRTKNAILIAIKIDPELQQKLESLRESQLPVSKRYKLFKKYLRKYISYYFMDDQQQVIVKKWRYKIKFNLHSLQNAVGKEIFLQERGTLQLLRLKAIEAINGSYDFTLHCEKLPHGEMIKYQLRDVLVKSDEFGLHFHTNSENFDDEVPILEYLKQQQTRVTIYLKKAINSVETGYILSITTDTKDPRENSFLELMNVHGSKIEIVLKKIETMVFSIDTISVIDKKKMSLAERFMQKILYWTHPEQLYYP